MKQKNPSQLPIEHIRRKTLAEQIIGQIKELIEAGYVSPGERLPSERELAQMFGVSRPSIREALRALSLLGIIENRPGSGTYLSDSSDLWPSEPFSILFTLNKGALLDIFEARKSLDGTAASLAARRRNEVDLETIHIALVNMSDNLNTVEIYDRFELDFHFAVIKAAKNNVIISLCDKLYKLLKETRIQFRNLMESPYKSLELDFRNHERIFEMIQKQDEAGAYEATIAHLVEFEKYIREEIGTNY